MQEKYQKPSAFQYEKGSYQSMNLISFDFFILKKGTDNDVYLQVIGKENKIDFQKMNNKWKNDFERNSLSTFEIAAPPIGKIVFQIME